MKYTGALIGVSESFLTGKPRITLEINEAGRVKDSLSLRDLVLDIELKRHRKKRSLNANSYYWVLITKIAAAIKSSVPEVHNRMLRRYGQIQILDGQGVYLTLKDTEAVRAWVEASEEVHLRPTDELRKGKDGNLYRTYMMLKGTHEYDSKEMSVLINGVVDEARDLGIETLTPAELDGMLKQWKA